MKVFKIKVLQDLVANCQPTIKSLLIGDILSKETWAKSADYNENSYLEWEHFQLRNILFERPNKTHPYMSSQVENTDQATNSFIPQSKFNRKHNKILTPCMV